MDKTIDALIAEAVREGGWDFCPECGQAWPCRKRREVSIIPTPEEARIAAQTLVAEDKNPAVRRLCKESADWDLIGRALIGVMVYLLSPDREDGVGGMILRAVAESIYWRGYQRGLREASPPILVESSDHAA